MSKWDMGGFDTPMWIGIFVFVLLGLLAAVFGHTAPPTQRTAPQCTQSPAAYMHGGAPQRQPPASDTKVVCKT